MTLLDQIIYEPMPTSTAEVGGDPWQLLRDMAADASARAGEWGGAPIPVGHVPLRMEPRYPFARINGLQFQRDGDETLRVCGEKDVREDVALVNRWRSHARQGEVIVCREGGRAVFGIIPDGPGRRLEFWMNTLGVCAGQVWDDATEGRAEQKLASLVTPHAFKCYRFVGGFLETSPRSKVTYLFRKLRPTIALRPGADGNMRVLAVLCLHPLGYYEESWAGVMCPTDDVIAHLLMMRGCEHQFWKKSNHHCMSAASAGI